MLGNILYKLFMFHFFFFLAEQGFVTGYKLYTNLMYTFIIDLLTEKYQKIKVIDPPREEPITVDHNHQV